MRWESLFADLEAQLESKLAEDLREEIAESIRIEKARQRLSDRLLGLVGKNLAFRLSGAQEVTGRVGPVGQDYLCLEEAAVNWLIRLESVRSIALADQTLSPNGTLSQVKFGAVVRAMLRDRQAVQVFALDGALLGEGILQQAAEDFLVLGIHPRDEFARPRNLQGRVLIPYRAVGWITGQHPD
ncbi:hypothetical protein [Glutamicibacter uratoxydans]|uniref:hypothetical protein n=1 Tax=Glutamicibacter uratoxydans TaxID=43667 RepID=UPI003D70076E